jgi:hypothetical protein
MKNMKKIIPALAMLLVSAVLLGTSTFAWFSMNTSVTVTGMELIAKTNNATLLISKTNTTASAIQTENVITVDMELSGASATVFPSAPALTSAEAAYLSVAEGHNTTAGAAISTAGVIIDNAAKADAVTNWYTASALAPAAATIKTDTAVQLTTFTGYVIKEVVYLTVAAGSNSVNNLRVTPTITQKSTGNDVGAVKILIVTSDGGFANLTNGSGSTDIKGNNTALTDSTVLTVTFYIYYDGNAANVYTNNAANLTGATISLAFTVDSTAGV